MILTATPLPQYAAVRLELTDAGTGPATLVRTDANGHALVRLLTGQGLVDGELLAIDYEPALAGPVEYYAAPWPDTRVTLDPIGAAGVVLSVPTEPQYRATPMMLLDFSATRDAPGAMTHWVIDRADPIVVGAGPARAPAGTLTFLCADLPEAHALDAVVARGVTMLLRQPTHPGLDLYLTGAPGRLAPVFAPDGAPTSRWQYTLDYQQVQAPSGPRLGSVGWTYRELAALVPTYADVPATFATYRDLAIGPS